MLTATSLVTSTMVPLAVGRNFLEGPSGKDSFRKGYNCCNSESSMDWPDSEADPFMIILIDCNSLPFQCMIMHWNAR